MCPAFPLTLAADESTPWIFLACYSSRSEGVASKNIKHQPGMYAAWYGNISQGCRVNPERHLKRETMGKSTTKANLPSFLVLRPILGTPCPLSLGLPPSRPAQPRRWLPPRAATSLSTRLLESYRKRGDRGTPKTIGHTHRQGPRCPSRRLLRTQA